MRYRPRRQPEVGAAKTPARTLPMTRSEPPTPPQSCSDFPVHHETLRPDIDFTQPDMTPSGRIRLKLHDDNYVLKQKE
ncbi:hypothetical protein AKJ16_DCAP11766 [Drosera capensis]